MTEEGSIKRYNPRKRSAQKSDGNEALADRVELCVGWRDDGAEGARRCNERMGSARICSRRSDCRHPWTGAGTTDSPQPFNPTGWGDPSDSKTAGAELEGAWRPHLGRGKRELHSSDFKRKCARAVVGGGSGRRQPGTNCDGTPRLCVSAGIPC